MEQTFTLTLSGVDQTQAEAILRHGVELLTQHDSNLKVKITQEREVKTTETVTIAES